MLTYQSESSQWERSERCERLAPVIHIITTARRYTSAWYVAYLLLGTVTAGLLPIVLPLAVLAFSHRLSWVAHVLAAYNVGLLTCPLWGMVSERTKSYRKLFLGSFLLAAGGIVVLLLFRQLPLWILSAFAIGAGSGGGATLATLFIVDFTEKAEWEARLGWLQSFNASGQVLGLMLAAALLRRGDTGALWLCVAILLLAMAIGSLNLPLSDSARLTDAAGQNPRRPSSVQVLARFPKLSLRSAYGLHFYDWNLARLRGLWQAFGVTFGRFLLSWFALAFAVAAFFAYFPLMLSESYNIPAHATAVIYGASSTIAIGLYVFASHLTLRYGPGRVYHSGLALRIFGFGLLLVPFLISVASRPLFGAAGFAAVVIAWPLLSVSGTDLATRLTHFGEGAAVGLQNATVALATVVGIVFTGPLVARWGYGAIPATALAGLTASLLMDNNIWRDSKHAASRRTRRERRSCGQSADAQTV